MKKKPLFLLIMRMSIFQLSLILSLVGNVIANDGKAQALLDKKITLKESNIKFDNLLDSIEKLGNFSFVYKTELVNSNKKLAIDVDKLSLSKVLDQVLAPFNLQYEVSNNYIIIKTAENPKDGILDITVRGLVTDSKGETLPGVSVKIKGTQTASQTDANGNYSIKVPDGQSVLVFTYIGFIQQEIKVGIQTKINVTLKDDQQSLEEVVVVGYGSQRKQDVTGSISKVQGSELAKQPVQNPAQAVQGKVSGVQVIASGQPNEQPQVRVRGAGSMLGGINPLYVVDGVLTDDIRNVNSSDIVTMDVLKDASAAIYGVRAANGVVIITTKKGSVGATKVSYDANMGFREASNLVPMANRDQYIAYINEVAPSRTTDVSPLTYGGTTNWYDAVLRRGQYHNHTIRVSGGTEKSTFYVSGGFISENGIITTNSFKRATFRANNDIKISSKLRLGAQISYSNANERAVATGNNYRNIYRASPIVPDKIDGLYGNTAAFGNVMNPLAQLEKQNNRILNDRFQGNLSLDYNLLKFLKFRSAFNTDLQYGQDRTYLYQFKADVNTFLAAGGNQFQNNSQLTDNASKTMRWNWDNTLTYDRKLGKHSLTILAGTVTENFSNRLMGGQRVDVPSLENQWYLNLGNPEQQSLINASGDAARRLSYLSRVNYSYAGKYLLSASVRADGSSKFKEKWGYFPTVGLGWLISEEKFLKNNGVFDKLKLRATWGVLGNDNIASNLYLTTAATNLPYFYGGALSLGTTFVDVKDNNLKWEKSEQYDIGLEFALLNNRLTGEVDYYNKKTRDALANVSVPSFLGDADNTLVTNAASFINRGVELSLGWKDDIGDSFGYNISGNITFNHNEITGLNGGQALSSGMVGQQGNVLRTDNGHELASFYVLQSLGVFKNQAEIDNYVNSTGGKIQPTAKPGDLKYADINGNGSIDVSAGSADRIYAGSYQPKFFYGFNLGLTYKSFDLSADFYGNYGNKIYNGKKAYRFADTDNIEASYSQNRWTAANPTGTEPRTITQNTPSSTYFIESGSFLRLNNLTLGYNLPKSLLNKAKISSLRFFATSQNLFVATKFSGFSPELPAATGSSSIDTGIEMNIYPTTRTFAFGINLGL